MVKTSNNILIITYYWPPGSSPGVQRWLMLSRELAELGVNVSVLTVKNGSFPAEDKTLIEEVHPNINVYRTQSIEPFRLYNILRGKKGKSTEVGMGNLKNNSLLSKVANYVRANFFIPDARIGWVPFATKAALKIIDTNNISTVITTGPPHSSHLIGYRLKQKTDINWWVDLRDPWTQIFYNEVLNRNARSIKKDKEYESKTVSAADKVFTVSKGVKNQFTQYRNDIIIMPNGYNERDFVNKPTASEKFTITFVGNLMPSQNFDSFWSAIENLYQKLGARNFQFKFVGNASSAVKETWKQYSWGEKVNFIPFVPHKEAVKHMQSSHLLYLPIPDIGDNKGIVTGKIFEYLATRVPILAVGPEDGDAAEILKNCERSKLLDFSKGAEMEEQIMQTYLKWKEDPESIYIKNDLHKIYSRKRIAHNLNDLLNSEAE